MSDLKMQKKQLWVILLIVFGRFLGISTPYLIFPAIFLNPEYSILPAHWSESCRSLFLGITLAAYPLGQFLGSPILGSLSDDYGRKKLLCNSLIIASICNLFTGLSIAWQSLGLLIASRFIVGLMEGNIAIVRAMAANITALPRQKTFGKIDAACSIAYLVGPLLGGLMAEKDLFQNLTVSTPFYFSSVLFVILTALSLFMVAKDEMNTSSQKRPLWQRMNLFRRLSSLFSNKHLFFLMTVSTCFTLAVDIFYEFGPVYLTIKWSFSPMQLVVYNGFLCLALVIGNGWLPSLISSRISNRSSLICSTGGLTLVLIGMILTDSPTMMMVLFTLSGFFIGLGVTLFTVSISNTVSDSIQGEVMGVQLSLRVLGDASICLFGSTLLILSSKLILILAAALSIVAMSYYASKNLIRLEST